METKNLLEKLRTQRKLTKRDVCNGTGIPYTTYTKYEYGERELGLGSLQKLADFYVVTTDYLLGRPSADPPRDLIRDVAAKYHLSDAQRGILAAYLYMDKGGRENLLEIIRELADGADSEEARSNMEIVTEAARSTDPGNAPHQAAYDRDKLEDMDRNAPRADEDM